MSELLSTAEKNSSFPRRRILWIDAVANLPRTDHRDGLAALLDRAVASGFTSVVVDVKPTSGEVLYMSRLAPRLGQWEPGYELPSGYDLLATALAEAEPRGLEVFAGLNIFVEGYRQKGRLRGAILADPSRFGWESVAYSASARHGEPEASSMKPSLAPISQFAGKDWVFVNPALPAVQEYEAALLAEVVQNYPVAGVILDRARYTGLDTDFSAATREGLSNYVGEKVRRWPEDVYELVTAPPDGDAGLLRSSEGYWLRPGPFFSQWLTWRAQVIHDFIVAARRRVKAVRSDALFGLYAGSWYPSYYELGVNWASSGFQSDNVVAAGPVSPGHQATGFAEELDLFMSGNYYPEVYEREATGAVDASREQGEAKEPAQVRESNWWCTVEGACRLVEHVTRHVRPTYGSLYLAQYEGRPKRARQALEVCCAGSDGVMIFDSSHMDRLQWWDELAVAEEKP